METENSVKGNQNSFLKYMQEYSNNTAIKIDITGSFASQSQTEYSDIDIVFYCDDTETVRSFIYGYAVPVFISHTINPYGILVVIYENGVALDIELAEANDSTLKIICAQLPYCNSESYTVSRLFHRSLIKYLSGKKEKGIGILNEIFGFLGNESRIINRNNYRPLYEAALLDFCSRYTINSQYLTLLNNLMSFL